MTPEEPCEACFAIAGEQLPWGVGCPRKETHIVFGIHKRIVAVLSLKDLEIAELRAALKEVHDGTYRELHGCYDQTLHAKVKSNWYDRTTALLARAALAPKGKA